MERLRRQKEIELAAMHPKDREKLERIGARGRKIGGRGQKVGARAQGFIDRRAVEGEKIVKKKIRDGIDRLIHGDEFAKRRKKK